MFPIDTVAVMGATEAGGACALAAALAGCAVRLHDASADALARAAEVVRARVERAHGAGLVAARDRQRVLDGVLFTLDLEEAATGADLAIAAGSRTPRTTLTSLGGVLRATAAVAAAGGTPLADVAAALPYPGRVLSLAVADGAGPLAKLAVAAGPATTSHVLECAAAFAARVNEAAGAP